MTTAPTSSQEAVEQGALLLLIQSIAYFVISSVVFFGNLLVILAFVFDKRVFRKNYNICILALAISDVLSAVNVIMILMAIVFYLPKHPVLGKIFCKLRANFFFPRQLFIFSVYIFLLLSVERWIAVVKPHKYSILSSRKRIVGCIFVS